MHQLLSPPTTLTPTRSPSHVFPTASIQNEKQPKRKFFGVVDTNPSKSCGSPAQTRCRRSYAPHRLFSPHSWPKKMRIRNPPRKKKVDRKSILKTSQPAGHGSKAEFGKNWLIEKAHSSLSLEKTNLPLAAIRKRKKKKNLNFGGVEDDKAAQHGS